MSMTREQGCELSLDGLRQQRSCGALASTGDCAGGHAGNSLNSQHAPPSEDSLSRRRALN